MTPRFGAWAAGCSRDLPPGEEERQSGRLMMGSAPDVYEAGKGPSRKSPLGSGIIRYKTPVEKWESFTV